MLDRRDVSINELTDAELALIAALPEPPEKPSVLLLPPAPKVVP
jgi:hypothetical protein